MTNVEGGDGGFDADPSSLSADPACGATSADPSSADGGLADLLLDRIQLGVEVTLPVDARRGAARFCAALARSGFLARKSPASALLGGRHVIGPKQVSLGGGAVATLGGRLDLIATRGGLLQVRRSSRLLPDAMRALRSQLPAPGAPASDGADNVAVPYEPGGYRPLLAWQLGAVACAVDAFVAALAEAAGAPPGQLRGWVWVQQAEFCRDYEHEEAEEFVRALADRPILGARHERARFFVDRRGNGLCLSWDEGTVRSPERKVYAKRSDSVRVEISLRNRPAVTGLLADAGAPRDDTHTLLGEDVAGALAQLALAAEPLLERVVDAVDAPLVAVPRTGLEFVLAFAPLSRLVDPAPRAPGAVGRRPGPGVAPLARLALERLLADGKFDARGRRSRDAVLVALRAMEAAGALRTTPPQPRLFTVAPELEAARQALANVPQQPLGGAQD